MTKIKSEAEPQGPETSDPVLLMLGTGKHLWSSETGDSFVERLRSEDTAALRNAGPIRRSGRQRNQFAANRERQQERRATAKHDAIYVLQWRGRDLVLSRWAAHQSKADPNPGRGSDCPLSSHQHNGDQGPDGLRVPICTADGCANSWRSLVTSMARIFWDTNLFIYLFEHNAEWSTRVIEFRQRMVVRGDELLTSHLDFSERPH